MPHLSKPQVKVLAMYSLLSLGHPCGPKRKSASAAVFAAQKAFPPGPNKGQAAGRVSGGDERLGPGTYGQLALAQRGVGGWCCSCSDTPAAKVHLQ